MLIRNPVILVGALLGISGAASHLGLEGTDLEGVNPQKAARVRELIATDSREKTIHNLEECIPPEWKMIPIKGSQDGIEYNGDGTIEVGYVIYSLELSEHWYMWDLREMARPFLAEPVIELRLNSEECRKRVDFHYRSPVLNGWIYPVQSYQQVQNLVKSDIPALLRVVRGFHEMGVVVDFDHINSVEFFGEHGMFYRLELDPAFELKMLSPHQRAEDMRKLARALKVSMNLDLVVVGFNEELARLVGELGEVPDYDAWIESLGSGPEFYDAANILKRALDAGFENQFVICRWISLILDELEQHRRTCSFSNIDEQWQCLLGPELVQLVRTTHGDHKCQSLLAELVVERVKRVYSLTGSVVKFALWLHRQLADWEDMDLCSELDELKHIMFYYVVCPRKHFWMQREYIGEIGAGEVASTEEVEKLWSLLRFPEFAEEFKNLKHALEHAFLITKYLFDMATPSPAHLVGIETMCKSHSEIILQIVSRSRSFIRLATACGLWEDDEALNEFLTSRVMSLKPVWEEGSCGYFSGRLHSVTEPLDKHLLHSYVLKCALESWRSPKENSNPVGLRDFARALPGLSESQVCSEPLMAEYVAERGIWISEKIEHMWMCGLTIPGDIVCRIEEDMFLNLLSDYEKKHVDSSILFTDFKATEILTTVDECTDATRSEVVTVIAVALRDIQSSFHVTNTELAARISDMNPLFCDHNNDILGRYRYLLGELVRAICPHAPFAKHYERKNILALTLEAWLISPEANGLRSFAASFTPLAESNICQRAELDAFIDYMVEAGEPEPLTELLWVCGIELPAKVVCLPREKFGRTFVSGYHSKGAEVSEFLFDFEATGVLDVIDQCPAEQQDSSVGSLIRLFGEIQNVYQLTDIQLRAALAGREKLEYFCRFNQNALQTRPADESDLVTILCPNTPRSIEALRRIVHSVPRPIRSKVLRVRSAHPFTDAVELLTDKFVEADVPSGIVLDYEVDATPMHEWLRLAGQEAGSLLFTQDGTQFQPNTPEKLYYALGRLIAIAAIREGTLGMHFPDNFFRELLTRRSDNDQSPISPVDIIREGLEYFYPVPRILEQLTPEEFAIMFT